MEDKWPVNSQQILAECYEQEDGDDIYDEVSEAQYRKIVKNRLDQDDFVVDDGVDGYNDHGMDDWDREDSDKQEEDDAPRNRNKTSGMLIAGYFSRNDIVL